MGVQAGQDGIPFIGSSFHRHDYDSHEFGHHINLFNKLKIKLNATHHHLLR